MRTCDQQPTKVTAKKVDVATRAAPPTLADRIEATVRQTVEDYQKEQIEAALNRLNK